MGIATAARPAAGQDQYHLRTGGRTLHPHCITVGDPERAEMIARDFLVNATGLGKHRGFEAYNGDYCGKDSTKLPVSIITHGMGGGSTGIYINEAIRLGARRIIRVGSCSTLWDSVQLGSTAIFTSAVSLDGVTENWVIPGWPCAANYAVVGAMAEAAEAIDEGCFNIGIVATTGDFNEGQGRLNDRGFLLSRLRDRHQDLVNLGVLAYEMEAAVLFALASANRYEGLMPGDIWAGACAAVYGNRITNEFIKDEDKVAAQRQATLIALDALVRLTVYALPGEHPSHIMSDV